MKKILKTNIFSFILGGLIFATVGVAATTLFTGTDISYTGNKVENAENIQQAIDTLYDKASNTECADGYEKGTVTGIGYECNKQPWQPTYYAFGDPTTSSPTTSPAGKNIYAALDGDGNKGVCIIRGGQQYCFKPNNWAEEQTHIQQVFSDINCEYSSDVDASYVRCGATDFFCSVSSDGTVFCRDLSDDSFCRVFPDVSVTCD